MARLRHWQQRTWLPLLLLLFLAGVVILWLASRGTFFRRDRTWESMQSRQTWRVALDPSFPPFEQLDEQNHVSGFDVDLAQAIADGWKLKLEIVPTGYDSLVDALQSGQVDSVISALPYDPRLTGDVAYSSAYFEAGIMLVVREEQACKTKDAECILGADDLAGRTVAVELGSAGDVIARRWQRETPPIKVQRFETPDAAIAALQTDALISALLIDNVSLRIAQGKGAHIAAVGEPIEGNPYVVALPIEAFELQQQLEQELRILHDSGDFAKIENKWFGQGESQP
ncbi:MAG: transporter substrate-binding domain-containing protein [Caldilineaceae bacterium]